jgi:hypothetical protein
VTKLLTILIWVIAFTIVMIPFLQRTQQVSRETVSDAKCDTDSDCGCEEDCLDGPPWQAVQFPDTRADYRRIE